MTTISSLIQTFIAVGRYSLNLQPSNFHPHTLAWQAPPATLVNMPPILLSLRLFLLTVAYSLRFAERNTDPSKMRSTNSAMLPLIEKVVAGFNKCKDPYSPDSGDGNRPLDIPRHRRPHKIAEANGATGLHHNIILWLSAELRGRIASC